MNFVKITDFGNRKAKFSKKKKKSKIFFFRSHKGDEAETSHKCSWHKPLHKLYFFYCRCPCAAQTFHIHVLIMGKVEIGIYFCVTADILTKVLLKCFWSSPLSTIWILSKSLILTGGYGNRKAKFSKKKQRNIQKSSSQKPYGRWSWNFA